MQKDNFNVLITFSMVTNDDIIGGHDNCVDVNTDVKQHQCRYRVAKRPLNIYISTNIDVERQKGDGLL